MASNFPHFHRYDSLKSALYIHAVSKNINTFPYRDDGRIKELTGAAEEELAQKSTEYFSDPKNSLTSGLATKGRD